jgi:hypothetical protein
MEQDQHKEGWIIVHPDGSWELNSFFWVTFKTKMDGYKEDVGPEVWMKTYRPDCRLVRGRIEIL